MNISDNVLQSGEKINLMLRELYHARGYRPYRMSKFEEYDFYANNKDFLVSDNVITFTDTNGKLMALKPDVTLSIIKNSRDVPDEKQRVYYCENVYRVARNTGSFKEITQTGLECFGNVNCDDVADVALVPVRVLLVVLRLDGISEFRSDLPDLVEPLALIVAVVVGAQITPQDLAGVFVADLFDLHGSNLAVENLTQVTCLRVEDESATEDVVRIEDVVDCHGETIHVDCLRQFEEPADIHHGRLGLVEVGVDEPALHRTQWIKFFRGETFHVKIPPVI